MDIGFILLTKGLIAGFCYSLVSVTAALYCAHFVIKRSWFCGWIAGVGITVDIVPQLINVALTHDCRVAGRVVILCRYCLGGELSRNCIHWQGSKMGAIAFPQFHRLEIEWCCRSGIFHGSCYINSQCHLDIDISGDYLRSV